jgi:hypothetical protein
MNGTPPPPSQQELLAIARIHVANVEAEKVEVEALLLESRADNHRATGMAARSRASVVGLEYVLDQVRRLCQMTIQASMRVQAIEQAEDTLRVITEAAAAVGHTSPGDAAWHSVWLHGHWRYITKQMTSSEREHAADAVARYDTVLAAADGEDGRGEPGGLRWWRDDS